MPIVSGTIYALAIPFVESFRHSLHERSESDSVVLALDDGEGHTGFGEAAPRPYVTGETVSSVLSVIVDAWPSLVSQELPRLDLAEIDRFVSERAAGQGASAARAAMTTAVLDLVLKRYGAGIAGVLPPVRDKVRYSGVITASTPENARSTAMKLRVIGIKDVKVKVGFPDDLDRIAAVRAVIGTEGSLRVDANGAWDLDRAVRLLAEMERFNIAAVEQPIPRGDVEELVRLKARTSVPLMADESMITLDDARVLAEKRAVDFFNIRVSKCGGLARSWQIAKLASENGIGIQVGSQVGETAILSAAGRGLAAAVPELAFAEGSFGDLLLIEDLVSRSIRFGFGGEAATLKGVGLGIDVDAARLQKYAVQQKPL